jgi:hypothetical protein
MVEGGKVVNMNMTVARRVMVRLFRFGIQVMLIWIGTVSLHFLMFLQVLYYLANASVIRFLFITVTTLSRNFLIVLLPGVSVRLFPGIFPCSPLSQWYQYPTHAKFPLRLRTNSGKHDGSSFPLLGLL